MAKPVSRAQQFLQKLRGSKAKKAAAGRKQHYQPSSRILGTIIPLFGEQRAVLISGRIGIQNLEAALQKVHVHELVTFFGGKYWAKKADFYGSIPARSFADRGSKLARFVSVLGPGGAGRAVEAHGAQNLSFLIGKMGVDPTCVIIKSPNARRRVKDFVHFYSGHKKKLTRITTRF